MSYQSKLQRRLDTLCDIGFELAEGNIPLEEDLKFDGIYFKNLDEFDKWALDLGYRMFSDIQEPIRPLSNSEIEDLID